MSDKKYTHGPWERVYEDFHLEAPNGIKAGEYYIANVLDSGADDEEQASANAILMACAPELLEMLENAADIIGFDEPEFYGRAIDLIAKAKGESQ